MSPTPNFEEDIFISYAHVDNQPLAQGLNGWINILHEGLRTRLTQLLGEEVKIWRDPKLQGNDYFADTLLVRLSKIAVMVSVLSPRYVRSDWCLRELTEFCKRAAQSGGVRLDDKSRIFKVVKTHIPLEEHPPELQGLLGYEFYEYDQTQGRAKEFSQEVLPYRDIRYWEKLEDLAHDIKQLVEKIRANPPGKEQAANVLEATNTPAGATLYLAETTSDLSEDRDRIKRELQQRGHVILPDRELPLKAGDLVRTVREYLERSQLSIHLIGSPYGIVPEEESRSLVQLQNDLAAERGNDFKRLIWMPPGLQPIDGRQQQFVDDLRLGLDGQQRGVELLQTKLEDLKTQIHVMLSGSQKTAAEATEADGARYLYLICDKQDYDAVAPLENYLFEQGLNVILPAMEGDEVQIAQDHKDNLLSCDAVMIYYGNANEIWLRMKLSELLKAPGYGRARPFLAKAVYVADPQSAKKDRLKFHDTIVIKNYGAFSPELLKPFTTQLQAAKGVQR